jgi:hypothetical protein
MALAAILPVAHCDKDMSTFTDITKCFEVRAVAHCTHYKGDVDLCRKVVPLQGRAVDEFKLI